MYNEIMTNIDEVAAQIARDERTRKALKIVATKYDEKTKIHLERVYSDSELTSIYNAMRSSAKVDDKMTKSKDRKMVIKIPDSTVYRFLDDVFSPKYGKDWLNDSKILQKVLKNEDLIQPWKIRNI